MDYGRGEWQRRMRPTGAVRSFNIPVQDMARASDFYREVLGWSIAPVQGSGGDYHRVLTAEADGEGVPIERGTINGGLFRRGTHGATATFLEVEVGSIDEVVRRVLQNGGRVVMEKRPMMDFAHLAIVQDPDGNHLGLMEYIDR